MTAPPPIHRLQTKSHDTPDELRAPTKAMVEVVHLEGFTIRRFTLQPGWRWSRCVRPVARTEMCQTAHVGHAVSGRIVVKMRDGTQTTILPGMSYAIPPGHDAWVEGNEPFVGIEFRSAERYART